jgi:predicted nucleotidyltransferase component of viral defense system
MNDLANYVPQNILNLLGELMQLPFLQNFVLGGGTALAFDLGYRRSIDIDLFTRTTFDTAETTARLFAALPKVQTVNQTQGSLSLVVGQVKLDLLYHPYPAINPTRFGANGTRLLSLEDLAAMKVNAVVNRGSKKDFSDLLALHEAGLLLSQALDLFCQKYGEAGRLLALRSLLWFEDAESEPDPMYQNGWTWPLVRQQILKLGQALL